MGESEKLSDRIDFLLSHSNIPSIFNEVEFDTLPEVHADLITLCRTYVHNFPNNNPRGMYLYSSIPGNAKSSLAIAIMKSIIRKNKIHRKCTFISFPELILFLRQKYIFNKDFDAAHDLEDVMKRSELLIIDDIGKETVEKKVLSYYYLITNKLYNNGVPIIFTSNLGVDNLSSAFEGTQETIDSILSRIDSMSDIIEMKNRDYRVCTKNY